MSGSALDTPMMRQFLKVKAQYPDAVIFYRMGDFYEMFLDDAERIAPILDIALTTRDKGKKDAVPMCGVPVHAADAHIKRLAELGHRIAICEQVEDPKEAGGKRLVRREVVEVVTPGLVGDPEGLDARQVVAVAAIVADTRGEAFGLAVLDASTADFRATEVASEVAAAGPALASAFDSAGRISGPQAALPDALLQELSRVAPRELLIPAEQIGAWSHGLRERLDDVALTAIDEKGLEVPSDRPEWPGDFMHRGDPASRAAVAIANYLTENQPFAAENPPRLRRYEIAETVVLDASTRRHLELHENSEDRGRSGTLIAELDRSACALGARRLADWLRYPLLSTDEIERRQSAVEWLVERDRVRDSLREAIGRVRDLERMLSKATRPGAVPRDLGQLRSSLQALPDVLAAVSVDAQGESDLLATGDTDDARATARTPVLEPPEPLPVLTRLLEEALIDEPPTIAKGSRGANETGYIREGYRSDLDSLRESATKGREWIAGLEAEERQRSGISTLKVRFHPVHGYSLEVGKAHLAKVPEDYERKQTLASVERFTTESLREVESKVMGANERAAKLEREIFEAVRLEVCAASDAIRSAADRVATLDALASLADVARDKRWVRPVVDQGEGLEIVGGRHPVVESVLGRQGSDGFVPNDTRLDPGGQQIMLLTGPNMSGKSTYLRQVALIVLMAQMGSFVPADSARVGLVDRVFTRVGASDRLAKGESTFMVEMRETSEILRQASRRSLVILDEIGRGTSTFDGLSIAWAVAEYLHDTRGVEARTLFATHYHELIALAESKPRIHNAHFEVREWNDEVIFLRRLVEGGANRSYGIQVARLAGLPKSVVDRARRILHDLEGGALPGVPAQRTSAANDGQLSLSLAPARAPRNDAAGLLADALRALDPNTLTPLDALTWIARSRATLLAAEDEEGSGGVT